MSISFVTDQIKDIEKMMYFQLHFMSEAIEFEKGSISTMHSKVVSYKYVFRVAMTSRQIDGKSFPWAMSNYSVAMTHH